MEYRYRPGSSPEAPLVLFVHGRAGNKDVMWTFERCVPPDFQILAVQAPIPDPIGGFSWWLVDAEGSLEEKAAVATDALRQGVNELFNSLNTRPRQIIGAGFSQGGATLSYAIQQFPDWLSGLAILAGFVVRQGACLAETFPSILIAHGSEDETVPLTKAKEGADYFQQRGAQVRFVEDAVGHKVGVEGTRALKDWLKNFDAQDL